MSRITLFLFCLSLFHTLKCSAENLGSHSLLYFATYMKGQTPFHEFSALLMLDDIQIAYYSSIDQTLYPRGPMNDSIFDQSDQKYTVYMLSIMHEHVRVSAGFLIQQCNITHDLPTHQSIFGCDADLDYSEPVRMIYKDGFEGDGRSELYFSPEKTLETPLRDPGDWDGYIKHWAVLTNDIFEPICRHAINRFLRINRKHVMRKVKPRVRLLQKALPDNGDVKVTCLATGFYPRHINLTLLRDGQPVPDHQITWGELLPNGDGTYQMRKSLEVSTEEVQHHQYTCTAQHLSLDNKLDISLEPRPGQNHVVVAVVMLTLVCLPVFIIFVFCRKRLRGKRQKKEAKDEEEEKEEEHTIPLRD